MNEYSMDAQDSSVQEDLSPSASVSEEETLQPLNLKVKQEVESSDSFRATLPASVIARARKRAAASDDDDEFDSLPVHFMTSGEVASSGNCKTLGQALSGNNERSETERVSSGNSKSLNTEKAASRNGESLGRTLSGEKISSGNCERLDKEPFGNSERPDKGLSGSERLDKESSGNSERLNKEPSGNGERLDKELSGNGERLDKEPSGNSERLDKEPSGNNERLAKKTSGNNERLGRGPPQCDQASESQPSSGSRETLQLHSQQASSINVCARTSEQASLPPVQDSSNLFQCGVCPEKYSDPSKLALHIRARHMVSERSVRCGECLKVFKFVSHLREHSVVHTGEKPFRCDECGSQFGQASNLRAHVKAMHRIERPYKCEACPAAFPSHRPLVGHMKSHTEQRPYQCDRCPSAFPNPKYLHKHKKKTHELNHPDKSDPCAISKLKPTEGRSQSHVRGEADERPYKCDQCTISFKRPAHLTVHKRSHTRVKPTTECEICQKVFSTPQSLEKHKKLHLTDKIAKVYRCEESECFQHFKHVTGLNQHKVIAHGFSFINGAYRKASI